MKKTNAICIIGLIALIGAMMMVTPVVAQEEQWNETFGGTGSDVGKSVQQTSDGGYIIAGRTGSYGAGNEDVWLIKTDSNGFEQWNKTFGGTGTNIDKGESVLQASDGGYVIAGYTNSYGAGSLDVWLIKTDSNGIEQWNKTFGESGGDWGESVNRTSDGGYIITGYTNKDGPNSNVWLIKTDSNGIEQWNKTFGRTDVDQGKSVRQTSDGGYIIAGRTRTSIPFVGYRYDVWLIKTDSNGIEQWNKVFGVTETEDGGESVQQTSDGGYIIAGNTGSYGAGSSDVWLIKTDSNGIEQWKKTFGGTGAENGYSVQQTSDGGYIIAGNTGSYGAGSSDVWLIKTDSNGIEQWKKTFGGTGAENGYSVQQTSDGGYIIAGNTGSYGAGSSDVWLIKVAGGPIWTRKPSWDVPSVGEAAKPAFADLDNDGDHDLLIGEKFGPYFGYENTGSASSPIWTAKPSWNVPSVGIGAKPAFADLDNDGDYDLMIGEGPSGVSYAYENTGSASSPIWTAKPSWNVPSVGSGAKPAFADLDNDGDYDLMIGEGPNGRTFGYENTGSASSPIWTAKPSWDIPSVGMGASPALADLDSAGDYDLLIGEKDGVSYAYENTGSASSPIWTAKADWNAPDVGSAAGPAFADLDNDGDYDLLIGEKSGFSRGYENTAKYPEVSAVFDTGPGTYPSIMGTHKGEIKPSCNINVSQLYTYPCAGTGGHTESIELYENDILIANGTWNGYQGDYHNITITPSVTLLAGHTYNYTIVTGSYPQIHHTSELYTPNGTITCDKFIDANGRIYHDWIPAIRFFW